MSFLLDPYLSVILGTLFFYISSFFRWSRKVTIIATGTAAMLATFYSVVLYLDWLASDVLILDTLYPLIRVIPQKGSEIMFHTNITGVDKTTYPVVLAALFYALYPLWVFLGFHTAKNLNAAREPTPTNRWGTANYRLMGLLLFVGGALFGLYGLTMPTEYAPQVGFTVGNVAIWMTIIGVYFATIPKSERDRWWLPT